MKNTADAQINPAFVDDVVDQVIGAMEEKHGPYDVAVRRQKADTIRRVTLEAIADDIAKGE